MRAVETSPKLNLIESERKATSVLLNDKKVSHEFDMAVFSYGKFRKTGELVFAGYNHIEKSSVNTPILKL